MSIAQIIVSAFESLDSVRLRESLNDLASNPRPVHRIGHRECLHGEANTVVRFQKIATA